MTVTAIHSYEPEPGREVTMWASAALLVCALHVGLAATYLLLRPEPEARAEAPVFEVAFVPATTTPAPVVPETQQSVDRPPTPDQPEPPTKEPAPEPAPPQVEALVQPEPPPPPLALTMPDLPAETKAPDEVAALPPEAKPAEVAPPPEKAVTPPPERAPRKPVSEEKVQKESSRKPPLPKAVASPGAKPARLASAPNPGQESAGAQEGRASWLSEFIAHVRRFNTYAANGSKESGMVRVSITLDRNGRVLSHRVASSSGSSTLDRAALDMVQRAQPFPRFPASMPQAQILEVITLHVSQ